MDANKMDKLETHFNKLKGMNTYGSELALDFLKTTKEIGANLIKDGVANSEKEVNEVLMNGFFWLYGPINYFI